LNRLIGNGAIKVPSDSSSFLFAQPEELFHPEELALLNDLEMTNDERGGGLSSHTFMIMKATRLCNLRCTYCFSWRDGPNQTMTFPILARATRDVLANTSTKQVDFIWHGGEVTLLPTAFFKKALWLQNHFRKPGQIIRNAVQTNASILSDEWIAFLKACEFHVGVSIDGPQELHNARRITKSGQGSWQNVIEGIEKLRQSEIPFGILMVVDEQVVAYGARRLLTLFKEHQFQSVALLNVIPDNSQENVETRNYLPYAKFVEFLREVFALWWQEFRDSVSIRELESLFSKVAARRGPTICEFASNCMGKYLTIEPNGDVLACDKYLGDPALLFGNLLTENLSQLLVHSSNLTQARRAVSLSKAGMQECSYFRYCNGGCPHDARLNELHVRNWEGNCCGLSELIRDMELVSQQNQPALRTWHGDSEAVTRGN
jgi:uncharacterized protein